MTEQFQCQVVDHEGKGVLCLPAGMTAVLMFMVCRIEDVQANISYAGQGSAVVLCFHRQVWTAYPLSRPKELAVVMC